MSSVKYDDDSGNHTAYFNSSAVLYILIMLKNLSKNFTKTAIAMYVNKHIGLSMVKLVSYLNLSHAVMKEL